MKIILIVFLLLTSCYANWKTNRENLNFVYLVDDFRIFYSIDGINSLSNKEDNNKNNIPDFIENLGSQLEDANNIFNNKINLIKPLNNHRYINRVDFIDVHVIKLDKKINGLAGDGIIKYNYIVEVDSGLSISIAISNSLKKNNLTPAHELFHLYQNGYSMIKSRWYTEGTARYIESLFNDNKTVSKSLPQNKKELNNILSNTYSNYNLFKRLDELCKNSFLAAFLENLQIVENEIQYDYKLEKFNWLEKTQKNTRNNKYILKAIRTTIVNNSQCLPNNELSRFLKLVE